MQERKGSWQPGQPQFLSNKYPNHDIRKINNFVWTLTAREESSESHVAKFVKSNNGNEAGLAVQTAWAEAGIAAQIVIPLSYHLLQHSKMLCWCQTCWHYAGPRFVYNSCPPLKVGCKTLRAEVILQMIRDDFPGKEDIVLLRPTGWDPDLMF